MENIIGFLLIAGGVIYKIYTEYAKEQEKAAKRNLKKPVDNQQSAPPAYQSAPAQKPSRPIVPTVQHTKVARQKLVQQEIPEEVIRARKARELDRRKKPIEALAVQNIEEEQDQKINFDLRKAVIQAAILERPQY